MRDAPPPTDPDAIEDLRQRLRRTRRVPLIEGVGWDRGADAGWLAGLLEAWEAFDWAAAERRILDLPWRTAGDGMRLIDRAGSAGAPVVVLLHGWPDSVLRFARVLPLLPDLRVIVPALPGFPWGRPVRDPGLTMSGTADLVAAALRELGITRATVSGGDIGGSLAEALAARHPDLVAALHLTDVPMSHLRRPPADLAEEEQEAVDAVLAWQAAEGAYSHEQSTKPHTLAAALGDSPAGLAAWIGEKLRGWSDCGGDLEAAFPREDLLTWLSAYWFTGTIGTSFTPYVEPRETVDGPPEAPAVLSRFPKELVLPPRRFAERFFAVAEWVEHPAGGHFAAWEQPEAFAADLRKAVALAR